MDKKTKNAKPKTLIIIFCGVALLCVYVTFKYYNQSPPKNVKTETQTAKSITPSEENQSAKSTEQPKTTKSQETTNNDNNKKLTSDNAVEIIKNIVIKNNSKAKVAFDHVVKENGTDYYVIRLYESMSDHSTTLGWFYVEVATGKAFERNLTNNKLIPIN